MSMGSDVGGNNKKYVVCSVILHLVLGPCRLVALELFHPKRRQKPRPFSLPHLPSFSSTLKHGFPFPKNLSPKLFSLSLYYICASFKGPTTSWICLSFMSILVNIHQLLSQKLQVFEVKHLLPCRHSVACGWSKDKLLSVITSQKT